MENKYSYLNQLSIDQLENLLKSQRNTSSADEDAAFCEAIEEVILRRETLHPTGRLSDVDVAWAEFQKHYNTSEGEGLSLYSDDPDFENLQTQHTTPSSYPHKKRRIIKKGLLVAAILAAVFAGMIVVQASGVDIFGAIARWTNETFRFPTSESEVTSNRNSNLSSTYDALQATFEDGGIDESMIPGWYPDRYELVDTKLESQRNYDSVILSFADENDFFIISYRDYRNGAAIDSQVFEKDGKPVKKYLNGDRLYYLMTNLEHRSGIWTDGKNMIAISGDLTEEELKTIINNIGD